MPVSVGNAYVQLTLDSKKFGAGIKAAQRKVTEAATGMSKSFTKTQAAGMAAAIGIGTAFNKMSKVVVASLVKIKTVAVAAFAKLNTLFIAATAGMGKWIKLIGVAAVTIAGVKIVQLGKDFEYTMAIVQGVTRATAKEFRELEAEARKMGATTEWTARQSADALRFLGMAGFTAKQSIKALKGTLDLATAGNLDLARAADISTNALTAMNLPVEQLGRVGDAFIATITRSNVNIEQLAEAFKYVAPTAQALGYRIEEVNAMLGILGNAGIQGCYDKETDVLTIDGWKNWSEVTKEDIFATVNPETNGIEYNKPTKMIAYEYEGEMYQVQNKNVNLLVTPNHNMYVSLYKSTKDKNFALHRADNILGRPVKYVAGFEWNGSKVKKIILPGFIQNRGNWTKKIKPLSVDVKDFAEFLGYYLSEGSCDYRKGNYRIRITQKNKEGRKLIRECLKKLPFHFREEDDGFVILSQQLYNYVVVFGKCNEKFIPSEVKGMDKKVLEILYQALVVGDGDENGAIYTCSKQLADDIQEICLKAGYAVSESIATKAGENKGEIKGRKIVATQNTYKVNVRENQKTPSYCQDEYKGKHGERLTGERTNHKERMINFKGMVYCAEVPPNHILIVRRGGKVVACGNSMAGTQLSQALIKGRKAAKEFGLSGNDLITVLKELKERGFDADDMFEIFDIRAAKAALILQKNAGAYWDLQESIDAAKGEMTELAEIMRNTLQGAFKTLGSVIEDSMISMFKKVQAEILYTTKLLTDMIRFTNQSLDILKVAKAGEKVIALQTAQADLLNLQEKRKERVIEQRKKDEQTEVERARGMQQFFPGATALVDWEIALGRNAFEKVVNEEEARLKELIKTIKKEIGPAFKELFPDLPEFDRETGRPITTELLELKSKYGNISYDILKNKYRLGQPLGVQAATGIETEETRADKMAAINRRKAEQRARRAAQVTLFGGEEFTGGKAGIFGLGRKKPEQFDLGILSTLSEVFKPDTFKGLINLSQTAETISEQFGITTAGGIKEIPPFDKKPTDVSGPLSTLTIIGKMFGITAGKEFGAQLKKLFTGKDADKWSRISGLAQVGGAFTGAFQSGRGLIGTGERAVGAFSGGIQGGMAGAGVGGVAGEARLGGLKGAGMGALAFGLGGMVVGAGLSLYASSQAKKEASEARRKQEAAQAKEMSVQSRALTAGGFFPLTGAEVSPGQIRKMAPEMKRYLEGLQKLSEELTKIFANAFGKALGMPTVASATETFLQSYVVNINKFFEQQLSQIFDTMMKRMFAPITQLIDGIMKGFDMKMTDIMKNSADAFIDKLNEEGPKFVEKIENVIDNIVEGFNNLIKKFPVGGTAIAFIAGNIAMAGLTWILAQVGKAIMGFVSIILKVFEPVITLLLKPFIEIRRNIERIFDLQPDWIRDMEQAGITLDDAFGKDQVEELKRAWDEISNTISDALESGFRSYTVSGGWRTFKREFKQGIFDSVVEAVTKALARGVILVGAIAPFIKDFVKLIVKTTFTGALDTQEFSRIVTGITDNLPAVFEQIAPIFKDVFNILDEFRSKFFFNKSTDKSFSDILAGQGTQGMPEETNEKSLLGIVISRMLEGISNFGLQVGAAIGAFFDNPIAEAFVEGFKRFKEAMELWDWPTLVLFKDALNKWDFPVLNFLKSALNTWDFAILNAFKNALDTWDFAILTMFKNALNAWDWPIINAFKNALNAWDFPIIEAFKTALETWDFPILENLSEALDSWDFPILAAFSDALTSWDFPILSVLSDAIKTWDFPILSDLSDAISSWDFPILADLTEALNKWDFPILNQFGIWTNNIADLIELILNKDRKLEGIVTDSFQHGTSFVPRTGLALLHEGEAVIPASENERGSRGFGDINITVNANIASSVDIQNLGRELAYEIEAGLGR